MTISDHKYLKCVAREKKSDHSLSSVASYNNWLLRELPFSSWAPQLQSQVHFVKSNKRKSLSYLRPLSLIESLPGHSTAVLLFLKQ